jgi:hypothetical protein
VNLVVYDLLGKQVITLVDEEQNPGEYEIVWDADQFPSGVYFYRLTAGDPSAGLSRQSRGLGQSFMSTRKMLLIK